MFASLLAVLGLGSAKTGSQGCLYWMIDEPECPESLVK